ncbi:MAG TPA: alpha/beta hydrolase family protein [Gammaproteobacteria bacterium]|nr:alpha/beta hydrolase family protein [Gammaproteobacteria bacterium]
MKRVAWAAAALLLAFGAAGALWLADLARPRHGEFVERRGVLVAAETAAAVHEPGGFTSQAVRLRSDSGLRLEARVLRPEGQHDPLPIIVLLAGHRTGQDAVDLIGHPGDIATVAIDYPYHGSTDVRSSASFFRSIRDIQRALLDTPPAASLVLDWLETEPWADTGRVELVGVSFGAPFVAVAGALDERFRRVWFIHGGAGNRGWIEHNLGERIPQGWLRPLVASLVHLLVYGNSFDTEDWVARIAPRPVVIIGARDDEQLPEYKVEKLYAAAREPKELLWTEGGHVDPRRADLVRALLEIVRERVDRRQAGAAVP